MKISVSYLSSIYDKKSTIDLINKSNADLIHVDLMDGKFVPKCNFDVEEVVNDLKNVNKPLDIHLMTYNPEIYIKEFSVLNPEYITFHLESNTDIENTIDLIKSYSIKAGISIKPNTNVEELIPYLDLIDLILIMTVEPGAGGQRFMFDMLDKVEFLDKYRSNNNSNYLLSVDGGINEYTAIKSKNSGVDILVSGSFICKHESFNERINKIKK